MSLKNKLKNIFTILTIFCFFGNYLYAQKDEGFKEEVRKKEQKNKSDEEKKRDNVEKDWDILFGGTMLSYTAENVPPSKLVFEQFLLFTRRYGFYDNNSHFIKDRNNHQYHILPYIKFGIFKNLDFNLITRFVYCHSSESDSFAFGDTLALFGIQLLRSRKGSWEPDFRILIGENFPTGKYDELNPKMKLADATGNGAFETTFLLTLAKIIPFSKNHSIRINPNFFYIIPSSVSVNGFNIYEERAGIKGCVRPGHRIVVDAPWEINLTQNIIFGMDILYTHINKGNLRSKSSTFTSFEVPTSENFSLAPCLEYNPNKKFGAEAGVWFSIAGKNSLAFTTGIVMGWWVF